MLKDRLIKKLTTILATSVEPFDLYATPSGERGSIGLLYSDDTMNENLMLSCAVSSSLAIVLQVETYTGPKRTMEDQFLAVHQKQHTEQTSTYDENGVLTSRRCEICKKKCRLQLAEDQNEEQPPVKPVPMSKTQRVRAEAQLMDRVLVCAIERCRRAYHMRCSRWKKLTFEQVEEELEDFLCDECVLQKPLKYVDFVAHHPQNCTFLSEAQFNAIRLERDVSSFATQQGLLTLFDHQHQVVAVGAKQFHVKASSQDEEAWLVRIELMLHGVTSATQQLEALNYAQLQQQQQQQAQAQPQTPSDQLSASSPTKKSLDKTSTWRLPFAGPKAKGPEDQTDFSEDLPPTNSLDGSQKVISPWKLSFVAGTVRHLVLRVGNVAFWPKSAVQEVNASHYKSKTLEQLESCAIFEFIDEQFVSQFAFGAAPPPPLPLSSPQSPTPPGAAPTAPVAASTRGSVTTTIDVAAPPPPDTSDSGLWTLLFPRKTTCIKLLSQQIGFFKHQHIKQLKEEVAKRRQARANAKAKIKKKTHFVTTPLERQEPSAIADP